MKPEFFSTECPSVTKEMEWGDFHPTIRGCLYEKSGRLKNYTDDFHPVLIKKIENQIKKISPLTKFAR